MTTQPPSRYDPMHGLGQPRPSVGVGQPMEPPGPAPSRWSSGRIILVVVTAATVLAIVAGAGVLAGAMFLGSSARTSPSGAAALPAVATTPAPTTTEPDPTPSDEPVSSDGSEIAYKPINFLVFVKTIRKKCYGYGVGCNVTVRLKPSYVYEPDNAFSMTVKVTGDESGPIIETIDVDEDGNYDVPEVDLSTPRSSTKVKAKVTDIEKD